MKRILFFKRTYVRTLTYVISAYVSRLVIFRCHVIVIAYVLVLLDELTALQKLRKYCLLFYDSYP